MAVQDFIDELKRLGYEVEFLGENRIAFNYNSIEKGRFAGQPIKLGVEIPPDWNLNPPHGPHISPRLLPINPNAPKHPERVHESPFGPDWEHWSRPYPNWAKTKRTVKEYMRWIKYLLEDQ